MPSPINIYKDAKDKGRRADDKDFILSYLPLVKHVALRIYQRTPPNVELDDLVSYGILGLMDACQKFDQEKRTDFKTYAEFRIRGAILDELRSKDWVPRSVRDKGKKLEEVCVQLGQDLGRHPTEQEIASAMQLSIQEYHKYLNEIKSISFLSLDDLTGDQHGESGGMEIQIADDNAESPLQATEREELKSIIASALGEMSEKERMVITLYYFEELTFKEIGLVLGITESYSSQIHTQAIVRLKTKLRKRKIESLS